MTQPSKKAYRLTQRLRHLSRHLGIDVVFETPASDNVSYRVVKGRPTIAVGYSPLHAFTTEQVAERVAHEIGHYLAAPPSRRRRPDYGLDDDAYDESPGFYWTDETKAVFIEGEVRRRMGLPKLRRHLTDYVSENMRVWWKQAKPAVQAFLDELFSDHLPFFQVLTPPKF